MNTKIRLRDCNLFRFVCFVLIPLIVLIYCGLKPKSYYTGIVIMIGIYIILCASLNLVNGFSGMFSMGHAAFMAIGAYMAAFFTLAPQVKENQCPGLPDWLINTQIPLPPALLIGGIAAAIVAVLIGFPVVRTKGHYLSVVTLALIVVVRAVIDNQGDITHGSRGLTGLPNRSTVALVYIVVIITLFVLYRITHSDYGRGLIAMRDDPVAAQTLGINLVKKKISCFAISAFFAGVGGGLWGHFVTTISGSNFYFSKSFDIVEMSVIGGMFSLSGSIPGAMFFSGTAGERVPDRRRAAADDVRSFQHHHGRASDPAHHFPETGHYGKQRDHPGHLVFQRYVSRAVPQKRISETGRRIPAEVFLIKAVTVYGR